MGMKFRRVTIEDALKGASKNELKFTPEKNGKYNLYFPSVEALVQAKVHEWRAGGKFQSAACIADKEHGIECPFCGVEKAGWENYRAKIDEAIAGLDPVLDKEEIHKKKMELVPTITSQSYNYQLVAVVTPADKAAGTPETFALKVLRLSGKRLESFKSYAEETSDTGSLLGATLLLKYPDEDNARDRGKNMQILPGKAVSDETKAAVDDAAKNFDWESGMNGFYEFRDMSSDEITKAIQSVGYEAVEDDDETEEAIPFKDDKKAPATAPATDDDTDGDDGDDDGLEDLI